MIKLLSVLSMLFVFSCGDNTIVGNWDLEPDSGSKPSTVWRQCYDRTSGRDYSCTSEPISYKYAMCCIFISDDDDSVCKRGLFKCALRKPY